MVKRYDPRGQMEQDNEGSFVYYENYKELLDDLKFLRALEAAGVDSWEGYEQAQEMMSDDH